MKGLFVACLLISGSAFGQNLTPPFNAGKGYIPSPNGRPSICNVSFTSMKQAVRACGAAGLRTYEARNLFGTSFGIMCDCVQSEYARYRGYENGGGAGN